MTWSDAARRSQNAARRRADALPSGVVRLEAAPVPALRRVPPPRPRALEPAPRAVAMLTRPAKIGGNTNYVAEVADGQDIIRDTEVDADLDRIYGGHNDVVAAVNAFLAVSIGTAPPASPLVGQLWWRSDTGRLMLYFDDGTSRQWVPAMPS